MRIAYLAEWYPYKNSGVLTKIQSKARQWQIEGHQVRLFFLSPPPRSNGCSTPENADVFFSPLLSLVPKALPWRFKYFSNVLSARKLRKALQRFSPELIYFRQTRWFPGLVHAVATNAPYILELNSKDVEEIKRAGWVDRVLHLATRQHLLRAAAGFVAVSHEIADTLQPFGKPVCVIANGFDVRSVQPRKPPCNTRPQIVFVGSPGQAWHGVDKVLDLARRLPGFDFHIVGPELAGDTPSNVVRHGYLDPAALTALYRRIDVGIGSLALHRNNMIEASPLKVREYLSYGLPVIVGYQDTDLKDSPFLLDIGNHEENVERNVDRIVEFVSKWKDATLDMKMIFDRIDVSGKESKRLEFMERIILEPSRMDR